MHRGAVVGLGSVALNGHVPAWKARKDFEIVAGIDSSPQQCALFKKEFPGVPTFQNLEECLKSVPLDFVDIATPPHIHFSLVHSALRAGLNVLCEKPLVLKKTDLDDLEALQKKTGKVLMTVHNWKFAAICRKISELIGSNAVGDVQKIEWYVLRSGPSVTTLADKDNWRLNPVFSGGGILVDHGWHAFYLMQEWMRARPVKVQGTLENRRYEDLPVEDTAKVRIDYEIPGRSAEIFLTWGSRLRKNSGLVEGTGGRIVMEDDRLILDRNGSAPETIQFESALSGGSHHPDWFGGVIDEFAAELGNPSRSGKNFEIARTCFHLIEKSKESSERQIPCPL